MKTDKIAMSEKLDYLKIADVIQELSKLDSDILNRLPLAN